MEDQRGWAIAEGRTNEGRPLFVRIKKYEQAFPRSLYEHRLDISWPVSSHSVDGLPSPEEMTAMEIFENRVCSAVEADSQSTLSLVITGAGEREWVFYCRDPQEFSRRLSSMPHDNEPYPLHIEYELDQKWELFGSYLP
jgi:hypothetical protein